MNEQKVQLTGEFEFKRNARLSALVQFVNK